MSLTLQQLEEAYTRLITGQAPKGFKSANGKSVEYAPSNPQVLLAEINRLKRKQAPRLTRTRRVITSKGL